MTQISIQEIAKFLPAGTYHGGHTEIFVVHAAPGNTMGETFLIKEDHRWYALTKENITQDPVYFPIDANSLPSLETGPFGDALILCSQGVEHKIELRPGNVANLSAFLEIDESQPRLLEVAAEEPDFEALVDDTQEAPNSESRSAHFVKKMTNKASEVTASGMKATIEKALDTMEFVASCAAKRDTVNEIHVTSNIKLFLGDVSMEVHFGKEELRLLRERQKEEPQA